MPSRAIANGAPGWLNLVVLLIAWDAIKTSCLAVWVLARATSLAVRRVLATGGTMGDPRARTNPPWTHVGVQGYPADLR